MRTKLGNDVTLSFPKCEERGVRSEEGEVISSRKKAVKTQKTLLSFKFMQLRFDAQGKMFHFLEFKVSLVVTLTHDC